MKTTAAVACLVLAASIYLAESREAAYAASNSVAVEPEVLKAGNEAMDAIKEGIGLKAGEPLPPGTIVGAPFPLVSVRVIDLAATQATGDAGDPPPPGANPPLTIKALADAVTANLRQPPSALLAPVKLADHISVVNVHKSNGQWQNEGTRSRQQNAYVAALGPTIAPGGISASTYAATAPTEQIIGFVTSNPLNCFFKVKKSPNGLMVALVYDICKAPKLVGGKWYSLTEALSDLAPLAVAQLHDVEKEGDQPMPR